MHRVKGTHHVTISVSDLPRSLRFYCDVLGMRHRETQAVTEHAMFRFLGLVGVTAQCAYLRSAWNDQIYLYCLDPVPRKHDVDNVQHLGLHHIALHVEDVEEALSALKEEGIQPVNAPEFVSTGRRAVFVRDPDGTLIELIDPNHPLERLFIRVRRGLRRALFGTDPAFVGTAHTKSGSK
ncbi:MAG: VOC family protein [Deltaproteobacteria bacterium]|nr:VOC family protein [Deltaproteobacteria bacterium]